MFGKLQQSDRINSHLVLQQSREGAFVYGLVTKSEYSNKLTTYNYYLAFEQLIKDFKKNNLKTMICSPIGCVRNLRPLEQFVDRLLEFQSITGAEIIATSIDELSPYLLHSRMSHPVFIKRLPRTDS